MSTQMLMVEQRDRHRHGTPWVLEGGHVIKGHDSHRRLAALRSGLVRHERVRAEHASADDEQLERTLSALHEPGYLHALRQVRAEEPVLMPELAPPGMEPDMLVSAEPVAAAHEAVRTAITAAQRTLAGSRFTYALCRPPGHHAGPGWLAGYCYLNTPAAAAHTLSQGGAETIGILDLDLHYPNGTSAIVAAMDNTSLHSLHAWPVTNVPQRNVVPSSRRERVVQFTGAPSAASYLQAVADSIDELARSATVLILSLGYDTVLGDPHGCWSFSPEIFTEIGRLLAASGPPVCVVQEGGYALDVLADCSHAFARGLLDGGEAA